VKPEPPDERSNPAMKDSPVRTADARIPAADERALIRRSAGGDADAFRILVDLHRDRAYGLALRLLRSGPDAEEVAQDAFVRAWRAIGEFRGEASFSTWLYRIVWRRALDRAAILKTRRGREIALEDEGVTESLGRVPAAGGAEGAHPEGFEQMIAPLSDVQRAVVTLFYYEDRSVAEVGRALEMPEGTVKTHLSRARATLRRLFAEGAGAAGADAAGSSSWSSSGGGDDLV